MVQQDCSKLFRKIFRNHSQQKFRAGSACRFSMDSLKPFEDIFNKKGNARQSAAMYGNQRQ